MNAMNANYGSYGYGNANRAYSNTGFAGTPGFIAPGAFAPAGPTDSVVFSSQFQNGNYGVQDVCSCNFANNAARDAFIVPVGDQDNPFQNFNATALPLNPAEGQNTQQALAQLLAQLGITTEMIQAMAQMGIDLLALIAQANGVNNVSQLQPGQEIVLPTTMNSNSGSAATDYYGGGATPSYTAPSTYLPEVNYTPQPVYVPVPMPVAVPTAPAGKGFRKHEKVGKAFSGREKAEPVKARVERVKVRRATGGGGGRMQAV